MPSGTRPGDRSVSRFGVVMAEETGFTKDRFPNIRCLTFFSISNYLWCQRQRVKLLHRRQCIQVPFPVDMRWCVYQIVLNPAPETQGLSWNAMPGNNSPVKTGYNSMVLCGKPLNSNSFDPFISSRFDLSYKPLIIFLTWMNRATTINTILTIASTPISTSGENTDVPPNPALKRSTRYVSGE